MNVSSFFKILAIRTNLLSFQVNHEHDFMIIIILARQCEQAKTTCKFNLCNTNSPKWIVEISFLWKTQR